MKREPKPETPGINRLYELTCRLKALLEDSEGEGMFTWHKMVHDTLCEMKEFM